MNELKDWAKTLGFTSKENVKYTLLVTTKYITTTPVESRVIMRDHYVERLLPLRLHQTSDTCYTDTYFSSIKSAWGYTCFKLFVLQDSEFYTVYLTKPKSQALVALGDYVRYHGAKEMKSAKWLEFVRTYVIQEHISEPFHQNQNLAERLGGDMKTGLWFLLLNSGVPVIYWCYALIFWFITNNTLLDGT